jgi:hypothetical protein
MLLSMDVNEKTKENRLRARVERRGYQLAKSRRRDQGAIGYGTFQITDPRTNTLVAGDKQRGYGLDLSDVEAWLDRADLAAPRQAPARQRAGQLFDFIVAHPQGVTREDFEAEGSFTRHVVNTAFRDLIAELAGTPVCLAQDGSRSHGRYRIAWKG